APLPEGKTGAWKLRNEPVNGRQVRSGENESSRRPDQEACCAMLPHGYQADTPPFRTITRNCRQIPRHACLVRVLIYYFLTDGSRLASLLTSGKIGEETTMPEALGSHIRRETAVNFTINAVINGLLAWWLLKQKAILSLWGEEGFAVDLVVT